jgi:hypothetical protein
LSTEIPPVVEPATALAYLVAGTIDIPHLHGSLLSAS